MTRLLVTGGRNYGWKDQEDRERAIDALDAVHEQHGITLVMQGGATGADAIARAWAKVRNIPSATYEADWDRFGGKAGRSRHRRHGSPRQGSRRPNPIRETGRMTL